MEWRCRECGRTYDEPPEACVCGTVSVDPADGDDDGRSRFSLLALRARLLDPKSADRSLVRDEPYVAWAFRLLFLLALAGSVVLAVALLV